MPTENRLSVTMSAEDIEAAITALNTIRERMPFLISLTSQERRSLSKGGDRSQGFISKAIELATLNPSMLPPSFSLEELKKDYELYLALQPIVMALQQLRSQLEDTILQANAEAYNYARQVYAYAKAAGKDAGIEPSVEDMGRFFHRKPSGSNGKNNDK
ncbi:MAG: hypothetical protein ACKV2V_08040 [Blastocatellia bacterium]